MPIFRSTDTPPEWCELRAFERIDLYDGAQAQRRRMHPKERLLVTSGTVQLVGEQGSIVLKENQFLDTHVHPGFIDWTARACSPSAQMVRLSGRWGKEIAGCGIFRAHNEDGASDGGDPVPYPKSTRIDSHYHDCDEYWIVLEGRATVVVGGQVAEAGPGDCVRIGMGHHHDLPVAHEPVKAVFFETTLAGEKRVGHLWNHTHGPAQPRSERV